MKSQLFGLECEFTGITRRDAAKVLAEYFETDYRHDGGGYDAYSVTDNEGRKWKIMSDASIDCQKKEHGSIVAANREYACELVSPICKYEDIETIQEIVRKLRSVGAFGNPSVGIHCHVNGAPHTPKSIRNLINIVASKNSLLYKSLNISPERATYCKALDSRLVKEMNRKKPKTMEKIADIWYDGYYENRNTHYHNSRYHWIQLHSLFNGHGTIEFRGFNSADKNGFIHAGRIRANIQLSLAISHQALTQSRANPRVTVSSNEKYTFRTFLLRLGLIGDEFKTARKHLLENLEGNIAWKNPEDAIRQREELREKRKATALKRAQERSMQAQEIHEPQSLCCDCIEPEQEDQQTIGINLSM